MQLGMYSNVIDNIVGKYTGYVQIHANGYWEERSLDNTMDYSTDLQQKISTIKGVINIVPRLEHFSLASTGERSKGVMLTGMLSDKEDNLSPMQDRIVEGEVFGKNDLTVVIGKGVAKYFDLKVGDTLLMLGQGYHGMSAAGKFEVKGIIDLQNQDLNRSLVMMSLPSLQQYLSAPNIVSNILIVKEEGVKEEYIQKNLINTLNQEDYEIMTWKETMPELHQAILADNVGGIYMVFILYMIISFGMFSTILMMTQERIFEFGILTAIGMKKKLIIFSLWVETLILSTIGVLAGIIPAYPIMYYFHYHPIPLPTEKADMMESFGFLPEIPLSKDLDILLTHGLIIFSISIVIASYPTIKILFLNSLQAMGRK
jgi:ABC-type lipoprotein release transport system permease subunit